MERENFANVESVLNRSFDLREFPFSRFGSYFVIDLMEVEGESILCIRDIHGGDLDPGIQFVMKFYKNGKSVSDEQLVIHMTATNLTVSDAEDSKACIQFCMPSPGQVMSKGTGLSLKLIYRHKRYDSIYPLEDGSYEITSYSKEIRFRTRDFSTRVSVNAKWERIGSDHIEMIWSEPFEWLMTSYKVTEKFNEALPRNFEAGSARVNEDFTAWLANANSPWTDKQIETFSEAAKMRLDQAHYILWMNFVQPEGILKRPAMYMTKHYMTNIWSWDNCFGAIALAKTAPELAWNQLMMFADFQDSSGAYPDYANDQYASYSCVKPPIYAWAYQLMCEVNETFNEPQYQEAFYHTTALNTSFWLKERMTSFGLPCYKHGNDSGWDNGTFFERGVPVITPDLAAFLVYQTDFLGKLAEDLNLFEEAKEWKRWSEDLLNQLMALLWKSDMGRFVAIYVPDGSVIEVGDSLQAILPILIGDLLPESVKKQLVEALKEENRFLSEYGLATEAISSEYYQYNGYWRGPIWAPVTLIVHDALKKMDEHELALQIRDKWIRLIEKSGFYENFDPITGDGLVDPGFAWTASVFIHLLNEWRT